MILEIDGDMKLEQESRLHPKIIFVINKNKKSGQVSLLCYTRGLPQKRVNSCQITKYHANFQYLHGLIQFVIKKKEQSQCLHTSSKF